VLPHQSRSSPFQQGAALQPGFQEAPRLLSSTEGDISTSSVVGIAMSGMSRVPSLQLMFEVITTTNRAVVVAHSPFDNPGLKRNSISQRLFEICH
jgi:hypothetical protein